MAGFIRLLRFTWFTLLEYLRSGRILVELIAAVAFFYLFLMRRGDSSIASGQLFALTGLFSLALTLYTMSAFMGLSDRPQGYLLLARRLGRGSYLLGFYLATLAIIFGVYGLESIAVALVNRPSDLGLSGWMLGSLPLLLNVALMAALMLMLSSLVFSPGWRLTVLGALAFSSNLINGPLLQSLPDWLRNLLTAIQSLLSWPLVPPFFAYELSVTRDYSANALVIIVAQLSLIVALLGLSVYAFGRRELMFSGG